MSYQKLVFIKIAIFSFLILFFIRCEEESIAPVNNDPIVTSINAFPTSVELSDSFAVICSAYEPDGDSLFYDWSCTSGATISGAHPITPFILYHTTENIRIFYAPDSVSSQIDSIRVDCHVRDGKGGGKSTWIFVAIIK